MPAAVILSSAVSVIIAAIGLTIVVLLSLRDWKRAAADIAERRRQATRDRRVG